MASYYKEYEGTCAYFLRMKTTEFPKKNNIYTLTSRRTSYTSLETKNACYLVPN